MEGNRRDEIQNDLVVEVVLMVNLPLVPFLLVSFPCSSCADDFPAKKKVNNHILETQQDPYIILENYRKKNFLYGTVSRISHHYLLPRHQITCHLPPCPATRPSATTVAKNSSKSHANML